MSWDGSHYLYHPAYPNEIVTRGRYLNRVVGRGQEQYPPVVECLPAGGLNVASASPQLTPYSQAALNARFDSYVSELRGPRLPASPTAQPDLCQQYPYLVQCRPAWGQPKRLVKPKPIPSARPTTPESETAHPPTPLVRPRPKRSASRSAIVLSIVIANRDDTATCHYTLLTRRGEYSFSLRPGEMQNLSGDQDWRIRFDSQGVGTKTYQLRHGERYQFTRNKSEVWELKRASPSNGAKSD